jgi:hypothetical protein
MPRARDDYDERYTDPDLRRRLADELRRSDKGGPPGKWSARKSQLLVKAYERAGGGYREGRNREEARSLHEWTEQAWQTRSGSGSARAPGGMHRYLPAEAWKRLTPKQRAAAERSKREADRRGVDRVSWPPAVKRVMQEIASEAKRRPSKTELYLRAKALDIPGRSKMDRRQLKAAVDKATRNQNHRR